MENIHRGEEPGHFTVIVNLSEESITLFEEEIKYIRAKLIIKNKEKSHETPYMTAEDKRELERNIKELEASIATNIAEQRRLYGAMEYTPEIEKQNKELRRMRRLRV